MLIDIKSFNSDTVLGHPKSTLHKLHGCTLYRIGHHGLPTTALSISNRSGQLSKKKLLKLMLVLSAEASSLTIEEDSNNFYDIRAFN